MPHFPTVVLVIFSSPFRNVFNDIGIDFPWNFLRTHLLASRILRFTGSSRGFSGMKREVGS
jgi:hypothetical protein